jgi:hypothetical protein
MKFGAATGNKKMPGAGTDTDGVPWPPQRIHRSHQEVISWLKTIKQTDRIPKHRLRATTQDRVAVADKAEEQARVKAGVQVKVRAAVLAAARAMAVAVKKMVAGAGEWAVAKATEAVVPDE